MPADGAAETDDLLRRPGLPDDLHGLLQRHPRDTWPDRSGFGPWAQFWLERHDIFRTLDTALRDACRHHLDRAVDTAAFRQWALPRLNMQIGHLDLHHQVEEFHIFPAFAAVEPSLTRGYALLEADHAIIHPHLPRLHEAGLALANSPDAAATDATAALLGALDAFGPPLIRHLADEEDLLVPVVLAHGEDALRLH
jgi:hypothetical protein